MKSGQSPPGAGVSWFSVKRARRRAGRPICRRCPAPRVVTVPIQPASSLSPLVFGVSGCQGVRQGVRGVRLTCRAAAGVPSRSAQLGVHRRVAGYPVYRRLTDTGDTVGDDR